MTVLVGRSHIVFRMVHLQHISSYWRASRSELCKKYSVYSYVYFLANRMATTLGQKFAIRPSTFWCGYAVNNAQRFDQWAHIPHITDVSLRNQQNVQVPES